jgi:hypothetical protein
MIADMYVDNHCVLAFVSHYFFLSEKKCQNSAQHHLYTVYRVEKPTSSTLLIQPQNSRLNPENRTHFQQLQPRTGTRLSQIRKIDPLILYIQKSLSYMQVSITSLPHVRVICKFENRDSRSTCRT